MVEVGVGDEDRVDLGGSKPSGIRLRIASFGLPWNIPQSIRTRARPVVSRKREPVTVLAPPRKVSSTSLRECDESTAIAVAVGGRAPSPEPGRRREGPLPVASRVLSPTAARERARDEQHAADQQRDTERARRGRRCRSRLGPGSRRSAPGRPPVAAAPGRPTTGCRRAAVVGEARRLSSGVREEQVLHAGLEGAVHGGRRVPFRAALRRRRRQVRAAPDLLDRRRSPSDCGCRLGDGADEDDVGRLDGLVERRRHHAVGEGDGRRQHEREGTQRRRARAGRAATDAEWHLAPDASEARAVPGWRTPPPAQS